MLNTIINVLENTKKEFANYDKESNRKETLTAAYKFASLQHDLYIDLVKQMMENRHKVINTLCLLTNSVQIMQCQFSLIAKDLKSYKDTSLVTCFKDFETELNKMKQVETEKQGFEIVSSSEMIKNQWDISRVQDYILEATHMLQVVDSYQVKAKLKANIKDAKEYLSTFTTHVK
jgi:hypothetical protein